MLAEINGTRLYFERHGNGPTLFFIHGTALDHRMWRTQVERL
jgi:pimeloyl-ACP methyl ester carboxylesterase